MAADHGPHSGMESARLAPSQRTGGIRSDVRLLPSEADRSNGRKWGNVVGNKFLRTHGHNRSPTYSSWQSMKNRCLNPNEPSYARYGARGITVCDRWLEFANFLADMGERPAGTSLDRWPNAAGNYEPGNCRWATPTEQALNRRSNVILTVGGVSRHLMEWARITGVPQPLISDRIRRGWSHEDAVSSADFRIRGNKRQA